MKCVVRCLLVPTMVALFGRAPNWWKMPWRLARVAEPRFRTSAASHQRTVAATMETHGPLPSRIEMRRFARSGSFLDRPERALRHVTRC